MKKIVCLVIFSCALVGSSVVYSLPQERKVDYVDDNTNPRGEERPQDGKGRENDNRGNKNKNSGECNNPDKGPGNGNGEGRGNGRYRN